MEPGMASPAQLELSTTEADERAAGEVLGRGGAVLDERIVVLNPGGNNPAKRWPADRFAAVGAHLAERHGLTIVINGAPAEQELAAQVGAVIRSASSARVVELPGLGVTLGSLKAIVRRAALMVTNDTGPRHIAAAFGVPTVSLFGPTDPRWTLLPAPADGSPREIVLVADPTLPADEIADDHLERCRIDRIAVEEVIAACDGLVSGR
jgi:heptosyltransferase-2